MTAVDNTLAAAVRPIGFRYFDGFEFCCWHYSEAESTLSALQAALLEYNLRPNPRKTAILPLPQSMESKWLSELRAIHIRTNVNGQIWDLVRLFDRAFEFSRLFPEEPVLKFLAARIAELRIDQCNHAMVQALLLQVMACEPSVIPEVLRALIVLSEQAFEIDTGTLGRILNGIIASQAPLGHDEEVAWALWGCLRFRISLDSTTAKELAGVDNSIVAVLSLDAKAQALAPTLDTGFWQGFMDSDELYGPRWLLCYEANVRKWLPSVRQGDHVAKDPNFAFMKQKGVRFYALVTHKSPIPYANIRPVGAFW